MNVNTYVWGPLFILGIISLSEVFESATALYIEHGLSNLIIPAYIYGIYKTWESAVFEQESIDWWIFWGWLFVSIYTFSKFQGTAVVCMRYLNGYPYLDDGLKPSIAYLLNWTEHGPLAKETDEWY